MNREDRILKDYHITQSSNVKLFSAQKRRETAKPLQFLELRKVIFNCGRNARQKAASVRHPEINSLDPRMDQFLKLMMQSSCFFKRDTRLE
jgi:hypothetical protein